MLRQIWDNLRTISSLARCLSKLITSRPRAWRMVLCVDRAIFTALLWRTSNLIRLPSVALGLVRLLTVMHGRRVTVYTWVLLIAALFVRLIGPFQ
jgi:hypothetical protein